MDKTWQILIILFFAVFNFLNYKTELLFLDQAENFNRTYSSSVWCKNYDKHHKSCTFRDVCYSPTLETFLFYLTNESVLMGLLPNDLLSLQLSSIRDHNQFYMNITPVVTDSLVYENESYYFGKSFMLARFKPDNEMHVIHDDLLPLFLTLEELSQSYPAITNLVFHDQYNITSFATLYNMFARQAPIQLTNIKHRICFRSLYVGLRLDSIFFQYGFKKKQGPVESRASMRDLTRFRSFVLNKLGLSCHGTEADIVLLSRTKTRRILNEEELIGMIKNVYNNSSIIKVDVARDEVSFIIKTISCARVLVGMHGSAMIFSLFLPPLSAVIELFPYGIRAEYVSFVKAMSRIPEISYSYTAWHNVNEEGTIAHPDYPPLLGGINHLSQQDQTDIKRMKVVPAVECCHNPAYLYRMFQDTWVFKDFEQLLATANQRNTMTVDATPPNWLYPQQVKNITVVYNNPLFNISWSVPLNVPKNKVILYDIAVEFILLAQHRNEQYKSETIKTINESNLALYIKSGYKLQRADIWVTPILEANHVMGKQSYKKFEIPV